MLVENIGKFCVLSLVVNFARGKISRDLDKTPNYLLVPCLDNSECEYVNGTCVDNFCSCNGSHNCKAIITTLVNNLEEFCQSSKDCNIEFAVCNKDQKCICSKDYVSSNNNKKCLKAASGLGNSCEENVQCYTKMPATGCHDNKCVCQQHMHEFNGSCYKNVGLEETCQLFGECSLIPHATCVSKCRCSDNYISNGSACLLKANSINFTCSEDIQCHAQLGRGAECTNGECRCNEMFNFKPSTNQCVQDMLLNEVCGKHNDCHQPGPESSRLECVLGVCACKPPYLEDKGFCISSSTSAVLFKSIMMFLGTLLLVK